MRPYPRGVITGLGIALFGAIEVFPLVQADGSPLLRHGLALAFLVIAIAARSVPGRAFPAPKAAH